MEKNNDFACIDVEDEGATQAPEPLSEDGLLEDLHARMSQIGRMGNAVQRQKRYEEAQRARQITTFAFRQENIRLTDEVPSKVFSQLIAFLTADRAAMVQDSIDFINKRIADCLITLMPKEVRRCWKVYPEALKVCPGFHYQASVEYGRGMWMWVHPKMPAYFKQGTEIDLLCDRFLYDLIAIDKTIVRKAAHEEKLAKKQVDCAEKLLKMKDQTYYTLLKEYPLWFEIVYNLQYPDQKIKIL